MTETPYIRHEPCNQLVLSKNFDEHCAKWCPAIPKHARRRPSTGEQIAERDDMRAAIRNRPGDA